MGPSGEFPGYYKKNIFTRSCECIEELAPITLEIIIFFYYMYSKNNFNSYD